jgi:AcrR family transcriptional regulator
MKAEKAVTLRQKHSAMTRDHILNEAYEFLVNHPDEPFSHEAIAARAGVGARTVYRYFPAQSDLYEELWMRVRKQAGTIFPSSEAEILPQIPILFGGFDRNEKVIRAVLESPAGYRVRERGAPEGRAAFGKSLGKLIVGRSPAEKRQVIAVFLAIYSAPFWELLRKRSGLSGPDAIAAAEWAMSTLIEGLRKITKQRAKEGDNSDDSKQNFQRHSCWPPRKDARRNHSTSSARKSW